MKIRHDILKQCRGNYMEMKKFNHKPEIDILRNSSQKIGCPEGCFLRGLGVPKRHPDTLLAKNMLVARLGDCKLVLSAIGNLHSCSSPP